MAIKKSISFTHDFCSSDGRNVLKFERTHSEPRQEIGPRCKRRPVTVCGILLVREWFVSDVNLCLRIPITFNQTIIFACEN